MNELNKSFWRWFGDSKIHNEDGSPKVVYHGTRAPVEFDVFQTGSIFADEDGDELLISSSFDASAFLGPHFTESLALATKFAEGRAASWDTKRFIREGGKGRVISVYLRIANPKLFDSDEAVWDFIWKNGSSHEIDDMMEFHEIEETAPGEFFWPEENLVFSDNPPSEMFSVRRMMELLFTELSDESEYGSAPREIAAEEFGTSARVVLIKQGYDGIIYHNTVEGGGDSYIVFEPNQIKSADHNRGEWDRSDASIFAGSSDIMDSDFIKHVQQFRMTAMAFAVQLRAARGASLMNRTSKAREHQLKAKKYLSQAERALTKAENAFTSKDLERFGHRAIMQLNAYANALDKMVSKYDTIVSTLY